MTRWRWSANVSRSASPWPDQNDVGQRLGGDHQRVDGDDVTLVTGQGAGVALGGADHGAGADGPPRRRHDPGGEGGHRGLLEEPDTPALDDVGQAPDQSGRVDRRAVRRVGPAQYAGGADPVVGLVRGEEGQVVLADAPGPGLGDLVVGACELGRRAGEHHGAALVEPAVDALGGDHPSDLADGGLHGQPLGPARARTRTACRGSPPTR